MNFLKVATTGTIIVASLPFVIVGFFFGFVAWGIMTGVQQFDAAIDALDRWSDS